MKQYKGVEVKINQFSAYPLPRKGYVHDTSYHIRQGPCKATRSIFHFSPKNSERTVIAGKLAFASLDIDGKICPI